MSDGSGMRLAVVDGLLPMTWACGLKYRLWKRGGLND